MFLWVKVSFHSTMKNSYVSFIILRSEERLRRLQLMDEGVAQLFSYEMGARKVVGTVGALQFEVLQHRLLNEYGAKVQFSPVNIYKACWISGSDSEVDAFVKDKYRYIARDKEGKLVFMAETRAWLQMVQDNFPEVAFHFISEF